MTPTPRSIALSFGFPVLAILPAMMAEGAVLAGAVGALGIGIMMLDALLLSRTRHEVKVTGREEERLTVHQESEFDLDWHVPEGTTLNLDVGIALPGLLKTRSDIQSLRFTPDHADLRTTWQVTPLKRGSYPTTEVFFRTFSPLGLWAKHSRLEHQITFNVYPNLHRDRRTLATLFTRTGQVGTHVQKQSGQGREYDQIRQYQPGDSPLDIHWKATAKRNSLVSRTYQMERTQNVVLAVDTSRLSSRLHPTFPGQPAEPILERYVNAANLLAQASLRSGDRFGFVSFSNRVEHSLQPGNGSHQLHALQRHLFNLSPRDVYADYDEWGREMRVRFRRRSLVILLSDLSDITAFEHLEPTLQMLAQTHLVAVAMIPLPGVRPLFDGQAGHEDPYARLAGHVMWEDLHAYQKRLQVLSVPLLLSSSEHFVLDVVNHYVSIKQLQRL